MFLRINQHWMLSGNKRLIELMLTKFYMPHCIPPLNLDWNVTHGAVSMMNEDPQAGNLYVIQLSISFPDAPLG